MIKIKCKRCGVEILALSRRKQYCGDCLVKLSQERNTKLREARRIAGLARRRSKVCEICGVEMHNVHYATKYCLACSKLKEIYLIRQAQINRQRAYSMLSEEEKARRIKLLSKKILEELDGNNNSVQDTYN